MFSALQDLNIHLLAHSIWAWLQNRKGRKVKEVTRALVVRKKTVRRKGRLRHVVTITRSTRVTHDIREEREDCKESGEPEDDLGTNNADECEVRDSETESERE